MSVDIRRRAVAEFLGTFALVLFGCGSIATIHGDSAATALLVNLVFGLTVGAMIYALGHLSGAHFNPAVTIAFASVRRFPWHDVPAYLVAQIAGGLAASGVHLALLPGDASAVHFGATIPTIGPVQALALEAVLTFHLMLVIISVATDKRVARSIPGLAIGGTVALCGMFGGPLSGCSMNPARSLAPALFAGGSALGCVWIFLIGPVVGAVVAAFVYEAIRGSESVAPSGDGHKPTHSHAIAEEEPAGITS